MSVMEITNDNFYQEVVQSKGRVLLQFWADWCAPSKEFSPVVDELSERHTDIKFGRVQNDKERGISKLCYVRSVPSLLLFENGEPVRILEGAQSIETIEEALQ